MNESHLAQNAEPLMEEPLAGLERMYIEIYLRGKGYTLKTLHELPEEDAKRLMTEASSFASTKLAEVETRAQFMQDIHNTAPPM